MSSLAKALLIRKAEPNETQYHQLNLEKLRSREIHEGCCVDMSSVDPRTTEPFKAIGWDSLLNAQGPIHENLIREFYASFAYTPMAPVRQVHFQLNTTKYSMSYHEFGKLLGLPSEGVRYYLTGTNLSTLPRSMELSRAWKCLVRKTYGIFSSPISTPCLTSKDLKIPFLIQHKIIQNNLSANTNFRDKIQAAEFAFLWHLQTGTPCDLTNFVIHRMMVAFSATSRELPYGLLLNSLFYGLKIPILGPSYPPTYRIIDSQFVTYIIDKAMKLVDNTKITELVGYASDEESSSNGPW